MTNDEGQDDPNYLLSLPWHPGLLAPVMLRTEQVVVELFAEQWKRPYTPDARCELVTWSRYGAVLRVTDGDVVDDHAVSGIDPRVLPLLQTQSALVACSAAWLQRFRVRRGREGRGRDKPLHISATRLEGLALVVSAGVGPVALRVPSANGELSFGSPTAARVVRRLDRLLVADGRPGMARRIGLLRDRRQ